MRSAMLAASVCLSILVGCSSGGDDGKSSSQDVVFHPSGPGGDVVLTITLPGQAAGAWPAHFYYGTTEVQLGVASHLPVIADDAGWTPIRIVVPTLTGLELVAETKLQIPTGETTIALGSMRLIHPAPIGGAPLMSLDAATIPGTMTFGNKPIWTQSDGTGPTATFYEEQPIVPTFPGHYVFTEAAGVPGGEFDVVAGQAIDANLSDTNNVATVQVAPDPTPATFPNASGPDQPQPFSFTCTGEGGAAPTTQQLHAQDQMSVITTTWVQCTWGFNTAQQSFSLAPGQTYVAQTKHLDVDDVDLTDAPGQKAAGYYTVALPDGTLVTKSALPTKTSIDLPPGTYTVTTTYSGVDSFSHTTTGTVTL